MPLKCYISCDKDTKRHHKSFPNMAVGSFILAVWGGGLSNAGHHDWPTTKNFKTTLAKTTLSSPQKRNLYPKISDSKPHIWSLFFISDFLAETQSQQNAALKITTDFAIQFRSKNLTHLTNFDSLIIVRSVLLQHS